MKVRALDLFCGAGGATRGLQLAGFHVTGVDIRPQPRYVGDALHQADAMTFPLAGFDFIWASPPCQKYTTLTRQWEARGRPNDHPDLIEATRLRLKAAGVPYVIENVPGSPLARGAIMLCGTMFGLGVKAACAELRRHRWFESSLGILAPQCQHLKQVIGVYGGGGVHVGRPARRPRTVGVWGGAGGFSKRDGVQQFSTEERREAMGIDWMSGDELSEAIPPAYSEWIGHRILAAQEVPA